MSIKTTTAFVLTEELKMLLKEAAEREETSVSAIVRRALKRYFLSSDMTDSKSNTDAQYQKEAVA